MHVDLEKLCFLESCLTLNGTEAQGLLYKGLCQAQQLREQWVVQRECLRFLYTSLNYIPKVN